MPFAAVGAAVAGAAVSSGISALTSKKQSSQVQQGQQQAQGISQAAVDESRRLFDPYIGTGKNALDRYADFQGLNGPEAATKAMEGFQASPGYQYQVDEGIRAVDAGAAATGILRSGATLKAETKLGQDLANQDFASYLERLSSLSDLGFRSVSNHANVLSGQATNQQETAASAAGQQASITGNQGKAFGDAAGSIIKNGLYAFENENSGGTPYGGYTPDWSNNSSVAQGGWDVGYLNTPPSTFNPGYY